MKTSSSTTTLCLLLLLLVLFTSLNVRPITAAVNCGTVVSEAAPCLGFVTGKVPKVPAACCSGLWQVTHSATTVIDRRAVCQCLKNAIKALPGVKDQYLSQVPKACHIPVGFPVSVNTNCNQVH